MSCLVLALAARTLPNAMRDPVSTAMRRTFLAPLVLLQERAELSRRAMLLVDEKTANTDTLTLKALRVTAVEAENDRLRQIMGLGARLRWGFVPAEALHGRNVRDETTIILSAGGSAGVNRLSPIIAPEGLVGVVDAVDPTMSHAMLWTHPDFRVSAMSTDGAAFGIAQSHLASATGGYLIELRGVPFRATLKPGALIVSSGWGGVWPRGIPVGTVIQEIKTAEAWARTYLLRPAVNPADVYSVMILRRERVTKGLDGVWASVAQADSAAQRIVIAGDSAAKAAALAEAAARRAALDTFMRPPGDSLRRATPRPAPRPPRVITDTSAVTPVPVTPVPVEPEPRDTTVTRDSLSVAQRRPR